MLDQRLQLQSQDTRAIRQLVVVAGTAGGSSLVQELQVAHINRESLIVVCADQITVGDIVGPGSPAVGLAGEGRRLSRSVGGPRATEAGGREGAEVAAVGADTFDDHEVGVLALDGVDLDGFEEVVGGVAQDDGGRSAEAAGEVTDGHAGAVDLAVVAGEEEVHVCAVADDGLVDGAGG